METFEISNMNRRADEPTQVAATVMWVRREWGGWNLVDAKTRRVLGWIVRDDTRRLWDYRICSSAFRGDGPTDQGDVMDDVPRRLYYGDPSNSFISNQAGISRDRWDAAHGILWHLVQHRAPAVGFGTHPEVTPWKYRKARVAA